MPRVFIPQEPTRKNPVTKEPELFMNFAPASEYGDIVVCLPPGRVSLSTQPAVHRLNQVMSDFSDEDYLVAVGDPSLIAIATAVAAAKNRGRFNLLKWDNINRVYIKVSVDIFHKPGKD